MRQGSKMSPDFPCIFKLSFSWCSIHIDALNLHLFPNALTELIPFLLLFSVSAGDEILELPVLPFCWHQHSRHHCYYLWSTQPLLYTSGLLHYYHYYGLTVVLYFVFTKKIKITGRHYFILYTGIYIQSIKIMFQRICEEICW